jgi:predicted aminopeptidase
VLADWRAAERALVAAPLDSEEERKAQAAVDRLREEYRRITAPIARDAQA